jgi:hypothetical protein
LLRPAAGIDRDRRIPQEWLPPRLVLTSPPYFGIHILYHRWQVRGRRETSAPYWLAGCTDGHYGAYYTFGDRSRSVSDVYLPSLRRSFESIAALLGSESIVVQLVGFSDPKSQLPAYKQVMGDVGLEEIDLASLTGRNVTWRAVPNRKWYTDIRRDAGPSKEILLIHRKK